MRPIYRFQLPSRLGPDALAARLRHRAPQRGLALTLRRDDQAERDHFRLQAPLAEFSELLWVEARGRIRADAGGSQVELEIWPRLLPALGVTGLFALGGCLGWLAMRGPNGLATGLVVPGLMAAGFVPQAYRRPTARMVLAVSDLILVRSLEEQ